MKKLILIITFILTMIVLSCEKPNDLKSIEIDSTLVLPVWAEDGGNHMLKI